MKGSKINNVAIECLNPIIQKAVKEFISFTPVPEALAGSVALGVAALSVQHMQISKLIHKIFTRLIYFL